MPNNTIQKPLVKLNIDLPYRGTSPSFPSFSAWLMCRLKECAVTAVNELQDLTAGTTPQEEEARQFLTALQTETSADGSQDDEPGGTDDPKLDCWYVWNPETGQWELHCE